MLHVVKNVLNVIQKTVIVVGVFITIFHLFFYFIQKDRPQRTYDPIKENRKEIYARLNDPEMNKTAQGKMQIAIYRSTICNLIGEACTDNPDDADKNFNHSLMGKMTNVITLPYALQPASGVAWAYNGLQNVGFVPKTYAAQGIGFAGLQPISELWKAFRNIAYMVLVLAMVAVGFMIMFRFKINPQTVITIENALPRFVIALLAITFSFAIAGFLIDLMYVLMGLGVTIITQQMGGVYTSGNLTEITGNLYNHGPGQLWNMAFFNQNTWAAGPSIVGMLPFGIQVVLRTIVGSVVYYIMAHFLPAKGLFNGKILSSIPVFGGATETTWEVIVGGILIGLIAAIFFPYIISLFVYITAIFLFFRIIFLLFTTYTKILLWIIFSPLYLLAEAIPGKGTFTKWVQTIFVHLLTFPLVLILITVAGLIANIPVAGDESIAQVQYGTGALWTPPFLYSRQAEGFVRLIGLVILFSIPNIVKQVKGALGVKDQPGLGVGSLFTGAGVVAGGALAGVGKYSAIRATLFGTQAKGLEGTPLASLAKPLSKVFGQTGGKP
jgi:hypothetical protein